MTASNIAVNTLKMVALPDNQHEAGSCSRYLLRNSSRYDNKRNVGFTLTELLIVICILALLLNIAAPSYAAWIDENRAHARSANLASHLVNARAKAILMGGQVRLCGIGAGEQCTNSFDDGWLVFQDINANGIVDSDEQIITVHRDGNANNPITATDGAGNNLNSISYNFRGFVPNQVVFAITAMDENKNVSLSRTGRVQWQ